MEHVQRTHRRVTAGIPASRLAAIALAVLAILILAWSLPLELAHLSLWTNNRPGA